MATKSNKFKLWTSIIITIIGCVLACSSIISNEYLKLLIVLLALGFGLVGIMKCLSNTSVPAEEEVKK